MTAALSLRLAAGLAAARHAAPQLQPRTLACLPAVAAPWRQSSIPTCSSICSHSAAAGSGDWRQPQQQRRQRGPPPAASYSVVTGSSGGGGSSGQPWRLIIYSKEGCHLCDGLKEKVEALLERAAFLPSALRWVGGWIAAGRT